VYINKLADLFDWLMYSTFSGSRWPSSNLHSDDNDDDERC